MDACSGHGGRIEQIFPITRFVEGHTKAVAAVMGGQTQLAIGKELKEPPPLAFAGLGGRGHGVRAFWNKSGTNCAIQRPSGSERISLSLPRWTSSSNLGLGVFGDESFTLSIRKAGTVFDGH